MTRREEREHIFKLLFLTEFYKEEELEQQEMMYYEGISDAKQEDLTYIRKKYEKIKEMYDIYSLRLLLSCKCSAAPHPV